MNVLSALKPNYPYVVVSHAQMGVLNLATSLLKANEEKCGLKVLAGLNFQTVNHGNYWSAKKYVYVQDLGAAYTANHEKLNTIQNAHEQNSK